MENSVSSFILVIATLLIGVVVIGLSAVFASNQYNVSVIQNQAQNIANGLYVSVSTPVNTSSGSAVFITVKDFSYQGQLYFTAFYVPSIYENDTSQISPNLAYTINNGIIYPQTKIGNVVPANITTRTLYYTNLNLMDQGNPVVLWETPSLNIPVEISLYLSPPHGYSTIVIFFANIQNKYIEVGYEWI